MVKWVRGVPVGLLLALAAGPLRAQDLDPSGASAPPPVAPASPLAEAELIHSPISFGYAGEAIRIKVDIGHPELARRAVLVYRGDSGPVRERAFERAPDGPYAAVIPSEDVRGASLGYALELEDHGGVRRAAFASRGSMHRVEIADLRMDARERALLARIEGRRSVVSARADYVSFGTSEGVLSDPTTGQAESRIVQDRFYRLEGAYSYRLLRTVSEFSIRIGVIRGSSPVEDPAKKNGFDVGLNYGAPSVRLRLDDLVHLEGQLLTSVTEVGFSGGLGAAIYIGDIFGSKLSLGFETIEVFGTRAYSQVDVAAARKVIVSAVVEATNMPHASRYGVRLMAQVAVNVGGGFNLVGRGGYQARDSASGGPAAGLAVDYAF